MEGGGKLAAFLGIVVAALALLTFLFGDSILKPDRASDPPSTTGGYTAPPAPPAPYSQGIPTQAQATPMANYVGTYSGNQNQSGAAYTVQLSLSDGAVGQKVGVMYFSSLGCQFNLFLLSYGSGYIDLQTQLVSGPSCFDATIRASKSGTSLNYTTYYQGTAIATGALVQG